MMDVRHFDPIFLFASLHKKRGPPWLFGVNRVADPFFFSFVKKVGDPATDQKRVRKLASICINDGSTWRPESC